MATIADSVVSVLPALLGFSDLDLGLFVIMSWANNDPFRVRFKVRT
ncbi:hypothetical protein EV132_111193 [Rhizobium sullae]|uniref:Uncharacterized protein n=1 Tax=Rhizobium sullae TaxID=50338 RepID=A0A4R3PYL4_RHISU|nr:hypothetical protein EV132_111193 [Rhizobium sullae]